jgi:hypothetical protein
MRRYPEMALLDIESRSRTAAGVADRVWHMTDVAALIAAQEATVAKRGACKNQAA